MYDMLLAENFFSPAPVKKLAAEFKRDKERPEYDNQPGRSNNSTFDGHVDTIHRMVLDDRCLATDQIV